MIISVRNCMNIQIHQIMRRCPFSASVCTEVNADPCTMRQGVGERLWIALPARVCDPEVVILQAEHVAELVKEALHHVFLAWAPHDVDAAHVAVNVMRLVTIAELHLVELAIGVHVQRDAGDAAGVLVKLVVDILGADGCRHCGTLSIGDGSFFF